MKIIGPALDPSRDDLITPDANHRTQRKQRRKLKRQSVKSNSKKAHDGPRNKLQWLAQAATELTMRRIAAGEQIDFTDAFNASFAELKAGIFNPLHWIECEQLTEDYFEDAPTISADTAERSYAYPDPDNIRTLATYGSGSASSAPSRYSGNSTGGQYEDTLLVWKRLTYKFKKKFQQGEVEPIFIQIDGTVTAYADRRGSAPMLSYIAKTWNVAAASSRLTTTEPPTVKSWSFYYRYKIPQTDPPYYSAVEVKKAIRTMRQPAHEEIGAQLENAVVLIAPRPMYGRGFNNNVTVTTQFDPTVKIWQIKPPLKMKILIADLNNGAILYDGETFTTLHDNAAEPGGYFAPRAVAAGPASFCAAQADRGVFTFYDRNWNPVATVNHGLFLPSSCAFFDGHYWCGTQPYDAATATGNPANTYAVHIYDEAGTLVMSIPTGIWGRKIITFANDSIWMIGHPTAALNRLHIEQWDATFTKIREWEILSSGTIDYGGIDASETELFITMGAYVLNSQHFVRKYTFDGALLAGSFEIPPNDTEEDYWLTNLQGCAWFKDTLWTADSRDGSANHKQLVAYNPDLSIKTTAMMSNDPYTYLLNISLDRFGE